MTVELSSYKEYFHFFWLCNAVLGKDYLRWHSSTEESNAIWFKDERDATWVFLHKTKQYA